MEYVSSYRGFAYLKFRPDVDLFFINCVGFFICHEIKIQFVTSGTIEAKQCKWKEKRHVSLE